MKRCSWRGWVHTSHDVEMQIPGKAQKCMLVPLLMYQNPLP